MSSDSASVTPSSAASARTLSQTSHSGVTPKSSRFIDTCARTGWPALRLVHLEAVGLDPGQTAARLAHPARDAPRQVDVVAGEVDVVGDEERSSADGDRAGRGMQPRRAGIGLAAALVDLGLEALVLAAPDVGQLLPVGAPRGPGVEVHRQLEAGRDALPEGVRQGDAVVHRRRPERDERDDVDRTDAWVLAVVGVHVDVVDGGRDEPLEGLAHGRMLAGDGEHRAVVAGVARAVEQPRAVDRRDGVGHPVDHVEPPPLGDVRDRLDQHR